MPEVGSLRAKIDRERQCVAPTQTGRLCRGWIIDPSGPPLCRGHWWLKDEYAARPWTLGDTKRAIAKEQEDADA